MVAGGWAGALLRAGLALACLGIPPGGFETALGGSPVAPVFVGATGLILDGLAGSGCGVTGGGAGSGVSCGSGSSSSKKG